VQTSDELGVVQMIALLAGGLALFLFGCNF
jgi:hypothetical protein